MLHFTYFLHGFKCQCPFTISETGAKFVWAVDICTMPLWL